MKSFVAEEPEGADRFLYDFQNVFTNYVAYYGKTQTIFYKGIMPSEKILDFPVDCNFLTGSVNL